MLEDIRLSLDFTPEKASLLKLAEAHLTNSRRQYQYLIYSGKESLDVRFPYLPKFPMATSSIDDDDDVPL